VGLDRILCEWMGNHTNTETRLHTILEEIAHVHYKLENRKAIRERLDLFFSQTRISEDVCRYGCVFYSF